MSVLNSPEDRNPTSYSSIQNQKGDSMIYVKYSCKLIIDDLKFENNWLFDDLHLFGI